MSILGWYLQEGDYQQGVQVLPLCSLFFLLTPWGTEIVVQHLKGKVDYFKVLKAVAFRSSNWDLAEFPSTLTGPVTS